MILIYVLFAEEYVHFEVKTYAISKKKLDNEMRRNLLLFHFLKLYT